MRCGGVGVLAVALALAGPAAAAGVSDQAAADLTGGAWQLVRFADRRGTVVVPDDESKYTVEFDRRGQVSVRIDCNRGSGEWRSRGGTGLRLEPLAVTSAMCPSALLTDRMTRDWGRIHSYKLTDGHLFLELRGASYEFKRFENAGAAAAPAAVAGEETPPARTNHVAPRAPLERTHWRLVALGGQAVAEDETAREAYIELDPETHRISGSGGCNRLMGSYELNGSELRFGRVASTMMACVKGMETEQAMVKALGEVAAWRMSGGELELLDSSGQAVARFDAEQR